MDFDELKIRNSSSLIMLIFGISAFLLGLIGLIRPEFTLQILNFDIISRADRISGDYTILFLITSSMASLNMGAYYILASLVNFKQFYWWTVPFRILTFTVFSIVVIQNIVPFGFFIVAIWELLGALATAIALIYEKRNEIE